MVDLEEEQSWTPAAAAPRPSAGGLETLAERQIIERVLDSMKSTLRIPLILRDMDDLSYEDIANMLGIGLSAAKMRIKRAREEFRERYELEIHLNRAVQTQL